MAVDLNDVVGTYVRIRDAKKELKREFDAADAKLDGDLERIEGFLLKHLNATGGEAVRTKAGTFYREEDVIPQGSDWDAFYAWVAENNAFEALERRIKKTFVKEYMESNKGQLPPGVSVFKKLKVNVRRNS